MGVHAFESVSSWRQEAPSPPSEAQRAVIDEVADRVVAVRPERVRVVVDGYSASGKTSLAHEIAAAVRTRNRSTLRATFDDFKKPWRHAHEHGYDRTSGEGYYRNAPDLDSARRLLLEPAGPDGSGVVTLCAHDPLTGQDHRDVSVTAPADAILIVDSMFGMRPEYDAFWDLRIWLDVPADLALRRGIGRDAPAEGEEEARHLHRDRYAVATRIYVDEVDPWSRADIVIDNTDFRRPLILRS